MSEKTTLEGSIISMLTNEKMILIDNDEGVRKSLSLFFKSRTYNLLTIENSTQALKAIKMNIYSIIICEEFLPDINGITLFKILKHKGYRSINILTSSYGIIPNQEDIKGTGIDYILTKPFSGNKVEAVISKLIKLRDIRQNWLGIC